MKRLILAAAFIAFPLFPAHAANIAKTYSYYTIGGATIAQIERELKRRGPQVNATGLRHPGATRMTFTTAVDYKERNGRCGVVKATVTVKARMILPRWKSRRAASSETRLIWDTLSADIKRHEESHVVIAGRHARELEGELQKVQRQRGCKAAEAKVEQMATKILAKHDAEQDQFDRIEGKNFESRLMRLLNYRLKQIEAGRLAHP